MHNLIIYLKKRWAQRQTQNLADIMSLDCQLEKIKANQKQWQKHAKANKVGLHFEKLLELFGSPRSKSSHPEPTCAQRSWRRLFLVCGQSVVAVLHLPSPPVFSCHLFWSHLLHHWQFLTEVFQSFIHYYLRYD